MEKQKKFKIYGKVKKAGCEEGISGLRVEAFDKDLFYDDRLGSAITDKEGNFEIIYNEKDFRDFFLLDKKPDIYLRIKDSTGDVIYTTEDKVKYEAAEMEAFNIVIPEKLFDKKIESERAQFKQLITMMKTKNYFKNIDYLKSMVLNKTKYEEIKCIGLYPEDNLLGAVIEIKLPYGFNGSLCSEGSKEYVAFYIDYNDGNGFVSVGAPVEVNVYDISFVNDREHLFYAVYKPFTPKEYLRCDTPQIVKVRAILSWEILPTGPDYNPIWGNVLDAWVLIKPKETVTILDPYPSVEITSKKFVIMGDKMEIKKILDASIAAEKRIKKEKKVEKERVEFNNIISENINYFGSITESTDKNKIIEAVCKLPKKTSEALLSQLATDPNHLVPKTQFLLKTSYEELKCVGLYPEQDLLVGIIEVKKPYGFNGNLCTLGSIEYVAFYIDWGTGVYEHVATSTVRVHDIPDVNGKHLSYAVMARIPDIETKLRHCSYENIVRVKAILSWNVDPTPFGHTYNPVWGNVLTRNIQIRPKNGQSAKCRIEIVNDVHVGDICQSEGLAIKIDSSGNTVPGTYDRPFGGIIACWGNINISGADYYRFQYSDNNGATWNNVTDTRKARDFLGRVITRTPDTNGWFRKSEYDTDVSNYGLTALVHWNSAGKNGDYLLRLELADASKNPLPEQTFTIPIRLDNTGPELLTFRDAPLPAAGVVVKDTGGNYRKCDTFIGRELIEIFGNFRDDYFLSFVLTVFGGNIVPSGVQIGTGRYDSGFPLNSGGIIGAVPNGHGQRIGTLNLCNIPQSPVKVKCAYGIQLIIWDRAIVGYVRGYEFNTTHHRADAFVTFNWDPRGCPP